MSAIKVSVSRVLTASALLMSVLGAPGALAQQKSKMQIIEEESWAAVKNFGFREMDMFMKGECGVDAKSFASCLMALEANGGLGIITTAKEIADYKIQVKEVLYKAGPILFIQTASNVFTPPESQKNMTVQERTRAWVKDHRENLEREFLTAKPEFPQLAFFIREAAQKKGVTEAQITAEFISNYKRQTDPYFSISTVAIMEAQTSGEAESNLLIGIQYVDRGGRLVLEKIVPDSPASRADLRQGDVILTINGQSADGMTTSKLQQALGKSTTVNFEIRRGIQRLPIVVKKAMIDSPNLTSQLKQKDGKTFLNLKFETFMDETGCAKISRAIQTAQKQTRLDGIILDLRGNGGGLVQQSVCIASIFLPENRLVTTLKSLKGESEASYTWTNIQFRANEVPPFRTDLPLAVLINGGSASASELLSGALRDYKRAWLIGDRTYGKGTVMSMGRGFYNNPALTLTATTGVFHQPDGTTNQLVGILPDFAVRSRPSATAKDEYVSRNEDRVVGHLPTSENAAVVSKRPRDIVKVNTCLDHKGVMKQYNSVYGSKDEADYQLFFALEVLRCN